MSKYKSHTEKGECVFCKIVSGELSSPGIFYNTKEYMAFLSLFPNMAGVSVVIPKKHFGSDVLKMLDKNLQEFILVAKHIAAVLEKHYSDVGRVGLVMEGTGIDHAHIKLYPMHGTGHLKQGVWKQYPSSIDTYFEEYSGYISSNDGSKADEEELNHLAAELKLLVA